MERKTGYSFFMGKLLPLILSVFWFFFSLPPAGASCPEGMKAFWKLDESLEGTYQDETGRFSGECRGTCPLPTVYGRNGSAQYFSGSGTGISVPGTAGSPWEMNESFSVEFWVKKNPGTLTGDETVIGRTDSTGIQWHAGLGSSGVAVFIIEDGKGGQHRISGSRTLADGFWHHVTAVWDADEKQMRLYADLSDPDILFSVLTLNDLGTGTAPITVGRRETDDGYFFKGSLDEIALYSRVLTEDEIIGRYLNGLADIRWDYCEPAKSVRIMPLGDSITAGVTEDRTPEWQTGYRQPLYLNLDYYGYDVNFIGSQNSGSKAAPAFDADHEGHVRDADDTPPGWTAGDVANHVYGWLTEHPADIVLLHIGSYDMQTDPSDVGRILNEIDRFSKDITVVLAKIINRQPTDDVISEFNENLEALAGQRIADGDKIILADPAAALSPTDMWDEMHPNTLGYTKMAGVWFSGLVQMPEKPPVSRAGQDLTVSENRTVTLDGSESFDPDGPLAAYRWAQISGVPVALEGADTPTATFTAPFSETEAELVFRLYVADQRGITDSDDVKVSVRSGSPPMADAGDDQAVQAGDEVILNGYNSQAFGADIVSYEWLQISGTPVTLTQTGVATVQFIAPDTEDETVFLVFELTVTDSRRRQGTDAMTVAVDTNARPLAEAGDDQAVLEGETVILDGSASRDPDGGIAAYQWTLMSGTEVALADDTAAETTFVAPAVGETGLVFQLRVTDKEGLSDTDKVRITVNHNGIDLFPPEVTRFYSATGRTMGIQVISGGSLVRLSPLDASSVGETVGRPEDFPYGIISAGIVLDEEQSQAQVRYYLPEPAPETEGWFGYGPSEGWIRYVSTAVYSPDRTQLTVTVTDGGEGDEADAVTIPDGRISHLSGQGVIPVEEVEETDDLIDCFIDSASASGRLGGIPGGLALGMTVLLWAGSRKRRGKK